MAGDRSLKPVSKSLPCRGRRTAFPLRGRCRLPFVSSRPGERHRKNLLAKTIAGSGRPALSYADLFFVFRAKNFFQKLILSPVTQSSNSPRFRSRGNPAILPAMANTIALKPCPFCGGAAEPAIGLNGDGSEWYYVECPACAVGADLEVWNNRPPPAPPRPSKPPRREPHVFHEGAMHDRSLTPEARDPWRYKPKFDR